MDTDTLPSPEQTLEILGEVESTPPDQTGEHPRWEFKPRQNPKWGTVEREGLVVGRGATRKVIPPDEVYKLAELGCSSAEIAQWFGITESTLKYNFSAYIAKAQESLKQKLRCAQIKLALSGNATMLIWLGKNVLGQSENPTNTVGNQPLPWSDDIDNTVDEE